MKKLIFISSFFFLPLLWRGAEVCAQTESQSIIAEGDAAAITLDHVEKITDRAVTKDTTLPAPAFTYSLQPKRFSTTVKIDTIQAAKMGNEPLTKLYRTYARLGVGNYATFMGEFNVGSLRSKSDAWGAHIRHFSAGSGPKNVAGDFSGFAQEDFNIFGKYFFKHHVLYGGFDYDRNAIYNYGSASSLTSYDKASSRQFFNYYSVNGDLLSHLPDSSDINHHVNLRYYHLADRYKTNEDNILLGVSAGRFIRTERLDADFGLDYNRNSSASDTAVNTIVKFRPMFSTNGKKFQAAIGMNLSIDIADETKAYFYPQASFSYDIINHIIVPYITLGGYLERNSYKTLSDRNPFMLSASSFSMRNTQHKYELTAGLRGSLSAEIVYDAYFSRVDLVNAPFFLNTTEQQDLFRNKFSVVYDDCNVVNVHGQIGWQHFEKIRITATGDYYQYKMANELHPWHTPTLHLSLLGQYNLQDKIIAHAEIYYLNGQYAKIQDGNSFQVVNMKGLVDVNIGFEYRYTKFLSAFLNFNNLAGQRYERWYAYPTQKFNLMGGLTYTF
ncbi:MAG TPA: hypothetical protein VFJ43_03275 [Bacteroidia bacterium]|nr:hypothetical protein [Bacteroidia bacterium]